MEVIRITSTMQGFKVRYENKAIMYFEKLEDMLLEFELSNIELSNIEWRK